ncbi:MAG: hypothetical protein A2Y03_09365 [Omnitrophica WOR_2 bacterium GWF2_38_59]|nr:MAG: hypothetical protein A2Y06_03825 [Omnitrophica WOR_2 bacterium GWA2_37_7]OGX24780.1 MAG: hypothetical protein A2Y03_09365 [Omnitrophica WOR_2 bacterium GWF2_38_59]OGX51086.1 MAG: hypothetical protein A2243_08045 [Omnitrophica WOR_2 bacterium RIFOXYA2_FULL_38_17]OGX54133.1 MAG: hypothetical protein A2267_09140 [Omnitrophica WOR_2 bacterium RIFOXYA12_FULL_38_10]OGX56154.1 MAG: hypothetical protein A2447_07805 [Omnitrophica WOR_2 bacterium RIFOXYC2_FULL_38_12]OGX60410.1 MAG: hypothetical 
MCLKYMFTNYKILTRVAFRIVLFLLFIEIFLRFDGWISLVLQENRNKSNLKGLNTYRIICIGDSNTALGGDESFPSQLDVVLNKLDTKRKYEVINKGLPAADSTEIVDNVEELINEYKPNMIVSMMGANDRNDLTKEDPVFILISRLKVFKLAQGVFLRLLYFKSDKGINQLLLERALVQKNNITVKKQEVIERKAVDPQYVKMLFLGLKMLEVKDYVKAEVIFKSLVSQDLDIIFLDRAYKELGNSLKAQGKINELINVFKYQFERDEFSVFATDEIRELCSNKKAVYETEQLLLSLLEIKPDRENINGLLGACYAEWGDDVKAEKYLSKVREIRRNAVNVASKKNYLRLAEILKKNKIKGIFVQYPMLSMENLEILFNEMDDSYDFILVDNLENFKEALNPEKYKEYFSDRSLNDRGHCTLKGNFILAENVAKVILNSFK